MGLKIYAVFVISLLIGMSFYYNNNSNSFSGLAESSETLLSFPNPTIIQQIMIKPGQRVTSNDTLALLARPDLEIAIKELEREIQTFSGKNILTSGDINSQLAEIRSNLTLTENQINAQIQTLSYQLKQNLLFQTKNLPSQLDSSQGIPYQIKILKTQLNNERQSAQKQIDILKGSDGMIKGTNKEVIASLNEQLATLKKQKSEVAIVAPHSGIINEIFARPNQNIPAYAPLISLNALTPQSIRGYLPEHIHHKLNLNDSVSIYSFSAPLNLIKGEVIGMGSRIVEIPMALRKFPEPIVYGREVLISIPMQNELLLSEKVRIQRK